MTQKTFNQMLTELNFYLGDRKIMPTSTAQIDALDNEEDEKDQAVGGGEIPNEEVEVELAAITDLDDTTTSMDSLSIDQIIAALQALKTQGIDQIDVNAGEDMDDIAPNSSSPDMSVDVPSDSSSDPLSNINGMEQDTETDEFGSDNSDEFTMPNELSVPGEELEDPENKIEDEEFGKPQSELPNGDLEQDDVTDPAAISDDLPTDPAEAGDDIGTAADAESQDPDHMGTIRTVPGAHLVYKRQAADGTYDELWIYNIGAHVDDAISIKKAILAGTDIPEDRLRSEDSAQSYELVTMGNAQMLQITGLPN